MASYRENQDFTRVMLSSAPLDDAIDWIKDNLAPADVFSDAALAAWAEENGFVREEDSHE